MSDIEAKQLPHLQAPNPPMLPESDDDGLKLVFGLGAWNYATGLYHMNNSGGSVVHLAASFLCLSMGILAMIYSLVRGNLPRSLLTIILVSFLFPYICAVVRVMEVAAAR